MISPTSGTPNPMTASLTAPTSGSATAVVAAPAIAAPTRFVSFLHPVNALSARALVGTVTKIIQTEKVKSLGLLISTPGGDVNEGVMLFNILRTLPIELTTYNIGNVDSIGNVVFLAGKKRVAVPSATFMFHGINWEVKQPASFELKQLKEVVQAIEMFNARTKSVIASNSTFTMPELDDLFLQARTENAAYAQGHGLVHDIADPVIPNGNAVTHSPAQP